MVRERTFYSIFVIFQLPNIYLRKRKTLEIRTTKYKRIQLIGGTINYYYIFVHFLYTCNDSLTKSSKLIYSTTLFSNGTFYYFPTLKSNLRKKKQRTYFNVISPVYS